MYFHACRKREIKSRSAQLRTPLASHKDIREKIVIAYRISGYTYRQKYARGTARDKTLARSHSFDKKCASRLEKHERAWLLPHSSEVLTEFYVLAAGMLNYRFLF